MRTVQRWIDSVLRWRTQGFGAGRLVMNAATGEELPVSVNPQIDPRASIPETPPAMPAVRASAQDASGALENAKRCSTCGNEYENVFRVIRDRQEFVFDSIECAAHMLAPVCSHCGCRILGHGVEADGLVFCCNHCARQSERHKAG
ncbi:MAG: hypothetical protein U0570_01115 [Phycisphaerales bacterium]